MKLGYKRMLLGSGDNDGSSRDISLTHPHTGYHLRDSIFLIRTFPRFFSVPNFFLTRLVQLFFSFNPNFAFQDFVFSL